MHIDEANSKAAEKLLGPNKAQPSWAEQRRAPVRAPGAPGRQLLPVADAVCPARDEQA